MRVGSVDRIFVRGVALAACLGGCIRLAYVRADERPLVGGDGFVYHLEALRLADGLGYTSGFGDVGAETAHHPPGWVSLLGLVALLGGRSFRAHQLVGVAIGLGVVVLVGWVGRRYFDARTGVCAAFLAAVHPGFWIFEAQVLAEPLALLALGVTTLVLWQLGRRPTLWRCVAAGGACGLAALVRSELVAMLAVVGVQVLRDAHARPYRKSAALLLAAALAAATPIAPWTLHNLGRFEDPVLLSTNGGTTLLLGNCPPSTYSGERMGYWDETCQRRALWPRRGLDRSQKDRLARETAIANVKANLEKLPITIPARWGRAVGVFRPGQTVNFTAEWLNTATWPVWAWVIAFWLLAPLAGVGCVRGRRDGVPLLPLLAPLGIAFVIVTAMSGDLRYRASADLGIVVLAAAAITHLRGPTSEPASKRPGTRSHPIPAGAGPESR